MINLSRILILAPHADDGELGCGGSIAKYCSAGKEVFYAAFSDCKKSLRDGLPTDTLRNECKKATALLGIAESNVLFFNYDVRVFPAHRQELLEEMVNLNKMIKPDLVFTPASTDVHQDHGVIHTESLRAFKNCSLLGYELPWNNSTFHSNCFIHLTDQDVETKIRSLSAYGSQMHRNYFKEDLILSLARVRGVQANTKLAEAFEVCRLHG